MFDLSADRDERREQQGYATPAEARAFLPPPLAPIHAAYGATRHRSDRARLFPRHRNDHRSVEAAGAV